MRTCLRCQKLQKDFAESFNNWIRDEFLNIELFATVAEAQGLADRWWWRVQQRIPLDVFYRLCSALQGRTPLEATQAAAAWPPPLTLHLGQ